ncbi:hypothetical protein K503DRAFT_800991 [Rhizopogon vinicolor AM-OR11-026]|uniref:Uncharacterized protein n=1 Tax=Rhizopogon vinicolor AM-OR11-026 TaxID=1314800 RepID=A0A1B7MYX2_9AGAM|nr:hypothetical protein K503DRAFT_800991 [Rhizopogon vinicolor AM-OR11-026]
MQEAWGIDPPRVVQYQEGERYMHLAGIWCIILLTGIVRLACAQPARTQHILNVNVEEKEDNGRSYQPDSNTTSSYPRLSTYDNSITTASPFTDTNRLFTAPTHTSTTHLSTAQPNVNHLSTAESSANRASEYSTAPTTTAAGTTSASYSASRPSIDAYGAFSDPAPSMFDDVSITFVPPSSNLAVPRASLATSPPTYEPYTGYRWFMDEMRLWTK